MTSKIDSNIIIDLSASEKNGHIEPNNLIQAESFKKLTTQIKNRLTKKNLTEPYSPALGNSQVFFIDGTRGAGKSTFLTAIYNALTSEKANELRELRLAPLQLLDPSKINIREHLFLSIIYKIKKNVDIHLQRISQNYSETLNDKGEAFRKQFKKLAGGLQLLNEDHNPLNSIDEEVFLDWGIERAKDGVELARNFQELVDITCKILDVDALVIAIDDADTNFKKGREVLELIRCYLDTPRFVVLITGDLELYSHLVRDHYFENIGERLYKQDPSRNQQREKLIDHLEDQYLLKLFPINKRIHLSPLWSFNNAIENISITHHSWKDGAPRSLDKVLKGIITDGLRLKSDQDINLFREFLLKQPLRSILQLLNSCAPHLAEDGSSVTPSVLSEAMRAMVLGSLYKKGIDTDALSAGDAPTLIDAVFRLTLEDGEFDTGAYLRPQPKDESLRKSFAALSTEVARHCENNTANTIRYLLQGPGSVALFKEAHNVMKTENDETALTRFKNYFSIGREEDALNWAWHAAPVIMGSTPSSAPIKCGVLRLNRGTGSNPNALPIDEILTNLEKGKVRPAFSYTLINVFDKDNRTYASIFNILGLMCRLLRASSKNINTHVAHELGKVRPTPTISAPRWSDGSGAEESLEKIHEHDQTVNFKSTLNDSICEWIGDTKTREKSLYPSAILIGKIWTRLYFSLINVAQTYAMDADTGPAKIMEFYALCVINAVLVEEHDHHYNSHSKTNTPSNFRNNPKLAGSAINSKFRGFKKESYPLTTIIAGCPLILGLLPQTATYKELFSAVGLPDTTEHGCPEKTFEYIDAAAIPRQIRKTRANRVSES
jgi:energy-coupling factor transporter ATP-binding protein EcfA2